MNIATKCYTGVQLLGTTLSLVRKRQAQEISCLFVEAASVSFYVALHWKLPRPQSLTDHCHGSWKLNIARGAGGNSLHPPKNHWHHLQNSNIFKVKARNV